MAKHLTDEQVLEFRAEIDSWVTWKPRERIAPYVIIGIVIAIAAGLLWLLWIWISNRYRAGDAPKCNGELMSPGDSCRWEYRGGGSYLRPYEDMLGDRSWILIGILSVIGLVVIAAAAKLITWVIRETRDGRLPTVDEVIAFMDHHRRTRRELETSVAETGSPADIERLEILDDLVPKMVKAYGMNRVEGVTYTI